jgi:hypothetical protein
MRDDFPEATKRRIATRAGHCCSRPECGAATSGPQLDPHGTLNVGVAAHIHAASEGGPRFSQEMSPSQRSAAGNGLWLCQTCAKLIDNDPLRYSAQELRNWKTKAEAAALEAIGKTRPRGKRRMPREQEIRRDLAIRTKLEKALLRPVSERRPGKHPTEMFRRSKLVVRSLNDTKYPEVDADPPSGISSWLVLGPYDFYHGGLMVILGIRLVVTAEGGHWAYINEDLDVRELRPGMGKAWVLGEIPWRNIREIDDAGDNHYRGPHLYCDYADNGRPYERVVARLMMDRHDWPLDPAKQMPDVKSLEDLEPASLDDSPIGDDI